MLNNYFLKRLQSLCVCATLTIFLIGQSVLPHIVVAQDVQRILANDDLMDLSPSFTPATMKGIELFEDNPLFFNFLIDQGDQDLSHDELRRISTKLIKYFLVTLTVPEDELWVNLSPYERERIISEGLGKTEMGRDLLAQDYLLKQLSASVMYPEKELGQAFWDRVYQKIYDQYQTTDVQLNTFNKIWIVPDEVQIYVSGNRAFVARNTFKVLLEKDYLSEMKQRDIADTTGASLLASNALEDEQTDESVDALSAQVVRDILLPEIQKEVNEGENFAVLRQIYNSMLLATWYKRNLKESLLGSVYMNQNKTTGVELRDIAVKQRIYERYLAAFEKGVFDYIKEEFDPATQAVIPRKYFSGGTEGYQRFDEIPQTTDFASLTKATQASLTANKFVRITSSFLEITPENKDLLLGTTEEDLDYAMLNSDDIFQLEFIGRMSADLKADVALINERLAAGEYNAALGLLVKWKNFYTGKTAQNRLDRIQQAIDWTLAKMAQVAGTDLDQDSVLAQALEDISDEQVPEKPVTRISSDQKILSIRGRMAENDRDLLNRINLAYIEGDLITTRDLLLEWNNLWDKGPRRDAGREAQRQVQSEIDREIAQIRDADQSDIVALTNLNRRGLRSLEPWFFKGGGSEALVRPATNELVISVFERIVQQTITQVAQSNFFEEMQPRVQVSGKMRYLMSGKFDAVNINFSEDYFDIFAKEDFDNLITLFVNALNDVVSQISPGSSVTPGTDNTNPVLNVVKADGQVVTFQLNLSTTNNPFDYVQKIRTKIQDKLSGTDLERKAEGIISAEYYLERDLQRYIQMRTSYETQTAEDFIANVGQERIDDYIGKLDRAPVYVLNNIRSRLESTMRPFSQAVEGNQQVIGKEAFYPVWNLIDQNKREFPGRAILTTILHRLIDHDRIVYRDDLPDSFWSFRDQDTGNYYIAVARSLQPIIESMTDIDRWNEGERRTLMTLIAAKLLNKATEIAMEPDPLVDWRLEEKDPTISNTMTVGLFDGIALFGHVLVDS
jgi:DNA-binding protein YbaB